MTTTKEMIYNTGQDSLIWFLKRDIFGIKVDLMYKGRSVYNTKIGAFLSFGMYIYMLYFAAGTFIKVWRGDTKAITTNYNRHDHDNLKHGINPAEAGFNMAFGFQKPLPKRIGTISVKLVSRVGDKHQKRKKTTAKHYPCKREESKWVKESHQNVKDTFAICFLLQNLSG